MKTLYRLRTMTAFLCLLFVAPSFTTAKPLPKADPFKTVKPCEVYCDWVASVCDFSVVSIDACGGISGAPSVTNGTTFGALVSGIGCPGVSIGTSLPSIHPAGTIRIYQGGVLVLTHTVAQNALARFDDYFDINCDEYFVVTFY